MHGGQVRRRCAGGSSAVAWAALLALLSSIAPPPAADGVGIAPRDVRCGPVQPPQGSRPGRRGGRAVAAGEAGCSPRRLGLRGGSSNEEEELIEQMSMLKSAGTADKANVNVVMIGHVDAGKSTISGHLLYLTGMLDERTLDKFARESEVGHLRAYTHTLSLPRSLSLPTSPSRARSRSVPRTPALEVAR